MDSLNSITFSPKAIGYALAISVVLCLALPCIAVLTYALLMLLSLVISLIGPFVLYVVYGPFILIYKLFEAIWVCTVGQLDCCAFVVFLPVICFCIGLIIGFFQGIFQLILDLISDHPTFRQIVIYLVSFWLSCLVLLFIFNSIGFYDDDKDYGMIIRSYANSSWNSIIGGFLEYKVYIFSWAPAVLAVLPTLIINGAILLYRLSRIIYAGSCTFLRAVFLGITVLCRLAYAGSCFVLRALQIGIIALFRALCIALRAILFGIITLFRAIYTGIYAILRMTLLGITIVIDWLFSKRKIRHICPNKDCGYIGTSSVYHCPHCGELLLDMKPTYGGIFYKECPNCHNDVGVSSLTGRNNYSTACPKCNNTWKYFDVGSVPSSVFIVDGAAQSGKTSFMAQMLLQWRSQFSENVHFLIGNQKNTVEQLANSIKEQQFCPSTPRLSHPEAYVMRHKKFLHSFLAYFYDTGGEDASSSLPAGIAEPYFNLANGIFWVIDPWAERCVLDAFRAKNYTRPQTYQYSKMDSSNVIGRLCTKLDHIYTGSRFDIPICVVVTKCDINRMDEIIGTDANYSQSPNEWDEQSQKVEEFLLNAGMHNFVNVIKTRFKKYAFFAVSVLDDSTHNPETVLNPLLWMIKNA